MWTNKLSTFPQLNIYTKLLIFIQLRQFFIKLWILGMSYPHFHMVNLSKLSKSPKFDASLILISHFFHYFLTFYGRGCQVICRKLIIKCRKSKNKMNKN